jgi:hypothetical protein
MTPKSSPPKTFSLISNAKLRQMYVTMLQCRILAAHARLPVLKGWEAPFAGAAMELRAGDAVFSIHGAIARYLLRSDLASIFNGLPVQKRAPVPGLSAQIALATGAALAGSRKKDSSVQVAFLSGKEGPSDTAQDVLRFAGRHKLPVLYVRSSVTEDDGSPSPGFPVIPVDATDVVAMYRVAYECILRARQGQGPSMMECKAWITKSDPVRNMERYLTGKGLFTEKWKQEIISKFEQKVKRAIAENRKAKQKVLASHEDDYLYFY